MSMSWRVVVAFALLTVACHAEANAIVDVEQDGSGQFTIEFGMDDEVRSALESTEGFVGSLGDLDLTNLDALDQRVEGTMTFYSLTRPFASVDDLETMIRQQGSGGAGSAFDAFDITVDEDGASIVASAPSPLAAGSDAAPGLDVGAVEQVLSANVYISLPGRIVETNADETIDGRMRWSIDLRQGVDIRAETTFAQGGFPWLVVGLAALAVLLLGGLAVAMARRKSAVPRQALAGVEEPPAPMGFDADEPDVSG